jgi:ATP-dependent helicase/nuclease subunit B
MFAAASAEEEAVAVDVQVRRWLLNGAASVGIVTEDRRLARRVRALLERAGITLDDRGGWALSTTSAATVLERWLQCVEEDFAYEPLLDVLKSPFVFADVERDEHLRRVYRLEEDVIRNENVARGLQRYRMRLQRRRERLPPELAAAYPAVETLLEQLQFAAAPLTALCDGRPHAPATLLGAVRESAQRLGLEQRWQTDAAGARVLHELDLLQHAAQSSGLRLRWDEFRAWLGRAFENSHFVPPHSAGAVQLLNLTQSATARFDAIVIAGCDYEHLPGAAPASPFFNDAVRRELGLPPAAHRHALLRQFFLGALERTPRVLLTRVSARDDEEVVASPWWDTLEAFHRLAWGTLPRDTTLEAYVAAPQARVKNGDEVPDPAPATLPRVSIASALLPGVISADSYQRLLDCPYQFYAAHCLKLKPPEHVREALRKDDFGARVHACLEAFFHPVAGLPPPFSGRVTHANREAAIAHLETIARAVFARDLEDNFQHRGWLRRWLAVVPEFIDWQIERAAEWTPSAVELRRERHAAGLALTLKGRLDRVDAGGAGLGIIDYKTGYVPSADDVAQGEAVQLPFYALLMKDAGQAVTRAEHVEIGTDKVTSKTPLEHATLGALADATEARLAEVIAQLRDGRAAPAWGDTKTCERCPMEGLCRKALWNRNGEEAEALGRGQ